MLLRCPYPEPRRLPWFGDQVVEPDQVVDIPDQWVENFVAGGWREPHEEVVWPPRSAEVVEDPPPPADSTPPADPPAAAAAEQLPPAAAELPDQAPAAEPEIRDEVEQTATKHKRGQAADQSNTDEGN